MNDNAIRSALAAARNVYNAQSSFNKHAFDMAVIMFEDRIAEFGFDVKGIDFRCHSAEALVWGRWDDEEYDRRDNDAYLLYETVNQYGTHYVAIDKKYRNRKG